MLEQLLKLKALIKHVTAQDLIKLFWEGNFKRSKDINFLEIEISTVLTDDSSFSCPLISCLTPHSSANLIFFLIYNNQKS